MTKKAAPAPGTVSSVPVGEIHPDPNQPRKAFDEKSLKALADNIRTRGVLQPLLVRRDGKKLVLVDGERRWRAAKLARVKTVPVLLQEVGGDDAQIRLDQVAVNNLREPLKVMDMARLLVDLREKQHLTTNEIAARLEKDGLEFPGELELDQVAELVQLPDWAQEMLDAGTLSPTAARPLLGALQDPRVLKAVREPLARRVTWSGRVTLTDAQDQLATAYQDLDEHFADLNKTEAYQPHPVLFNPAKACKGCEHLRQVGRLKFCANRSHFDELQAQAKEAGLLPGGKKPPKQEDRGVAGDGAPSLEDQYAAERKEARTVERATEYLDGWLRNHLAHAELTSDLMHRLAGFLAAGMPGTWASFTSSAHQAAEAMGRQDLPAFLASDLVEPDYRLLALAAIDAMPRELLRHVVAFLAIDVPAVYRIDEAFLDLHRKPRLLELAELGQCEDYKSLSVGSLKEQILCTPGSVDRIGCPPELRALWESEVFQGWGFEDDLRDQENRWQRLADVEQKLLEHEAA